MSCKNCYWCQTSLSTKKMWKCKLNPVRRFDYPGLHGWFCKERATEEEVVEAAKQKGEKDEQV